MKKNKVQFDKSHIKKLCANKIVRSIFGLVFVSLTLLLTLHFALMAPVFLCTFKVYNENYTVDNDDEPEFVEISNDIIIQSLDSLNIFYKIDKNGKVRIPYYARYKKNIFECICFDVFHLYYSSNSVVPPFIDDAK